MQTVKINLDWQQDKNFNPNTSYTKNYRRLHPELTRFPNQYQLITTYFQLSNNRIKIDFKPQKDNTVKVVYKYPAKSGKILTLSKQEARELYRQYKTSGYYPKEYRIECYKLAQAN